MNALAPASRSRAAFVLYLLLWAWMVALSALVPGVRVMMSLRVISCTWRVSPRPKTMISAPSAGASAAGRASCASAGVAANMVEASKKA